MDFVSTRIITDDIKRLVGFYEGLGLKATWYTEEFAELATATCTLAIGSQRTMDLFGAGAALSASNRSVILEFLVHDVDELHRKFALEHVVQVPTTQPWGNRSLLCRDPDGNLINFFTPVSPAAIRKYTRQ